MTKRELVQLLNKFKDNDIIVIGKITYDGGNVVDVQYCEPLYPQCGDKGVLVLYPGHLISIT